MYKKILMLTVLFGFSDCMSTFGHEFGFNSRRDSRDMTCDKCCNPVLFVCFRIIGSLKKSAGFERQQVPVSEKMK